MGIIKNKCIQNTKLRFIHTGKLKTVHKFAHFAGSKCYINLCNGILILHRKKKLILTVVITNLASNSFQFNTIWYLNLLFAAAAYFVLVATIAAFTGQHVVRKIIALLGRASIIIFILALTIFISAISLGIWLSSFAWFK